VNTLNTVNINNNSYRLENSGITSVGPDTYNNGIISVHCQLYQINGTTSQNPNISVNITLNDNDTITYTSTNDPYFGNLTIFASTPAITTISIQWSSSDFSTDDYARVTINYNI